MPALQFHADRIETGRGSGFEKAAVAASEIEQPPRRSHRSDKAQPARHTESFRCAMHAAVGGSVIGVKIGWLRPRMAEPAVKTAQDTEPVACMMIAGFGNCRLQGAPTDFASLIVVRHFSSECPWTAGPSNGHTRQPAAASSCVDR